MFKLVAKDYKSNNLFIVLLLVLALLLGLGFSYGWLDGQTGENSEDPETGLATFFYFIVVFASIRINSLMFFLNEEANSTAAVMASLPVKRSQIVASKFMGMLLQIVPVLILHVVIALAVAKWVVGMDTSSMKQIMSPFMWLVPGVFVVLANSFSFPFYFKFGVSKGGPIVLLIQFLILASFILGHLVFNYSDSIEAFIYMVKRHQVQTFGSLMLFTLIAVGTSILFSIKIYNNKEL